MIDPPFACPPGTVMALDLPMPPSANRIWKMVKKGRARTILSAEYLAWKRAADTCAMAQKPPGGFRCIAGAFEARIVLDRTEHGRADPDNRIKPLLDYAQRLGLIANDRHLESLTLMFGEAPRGCRLVLRALGEG